MSALFTALLEGETKESLAVMVCELLDKVRALEARITVDDPDWYVIPTPKPAANPDQSGSHGEPG